MFSNRHSLLTGVTVAWATGATILAGMILLLVLRAPHFNKSPETNIGFDKDLGWAPAAKPEQPESIPFSETVGQRLDVIDHARRHILLLGDSITQGWGLRDDETFARVLGREVHQFQVLNGAVTGYSPDQYYLYMKRLLPHLRPRLVVVIFTSNDLQGTSTANNYGMSKPLFRWNGSRVVLSTPSPCGERCVRWLANSRLFGLLGWWARQPQSTPGPSDRRDQLARVISSICRIPRIELDEARNVMNGIAGEMVHAAALRGARVLFVLSPAAGSITDLPSTETRSWNPRFPSNKWFQDFFRERQYDYFDLTPVLQQKYCEVSDGRSSCDWSQWSIDGSHYSVEGSRFVGKTLFRFISARYGIR